jgi:hypothetical protein
MSFNFKEPSCRGEEGRRQFATFALHAIISFSPGFVLTVPWRPANTVRGNIR